MMLKIDFSFSLGALTIFKQYYHLLKQRRSERSICYQLLNPLSDHDVVTTILLVQLGIQLMGINRLKRNNLHKSLQPAKAVLTG